MSSDRAGMRFTVAAVFLILHGYMGCGPDHWQTWLAGQLRVKGERVAYPDLPDPEHPRRAAWRAAFADAIEDGATVIAHSLACLVWLDHCADPVCAARPERVLLVAPPSRAGAPDALAEFFPVPLDAGNRDEYFLDLGATAFAHEVEKAGATCTLELFDGTHAGLTYRYPGAIRELVLALAP